jgi:hypothetical protein
MYLNKKVTDLRNNVLYRTSTMHNLDLYDMLYVEQEKKTITLFQVSNLTAPNHSFKMSLVDDVLSRFSILE